MTRLAEAHSAVTNAARAVRDQDRKAGRITAGCLAQLYGALDALDAVGDGDQMAPGDAEMRSGGPARDFWGVGTDRPGFCQGAEDCWRFPDVGRTCYAHSPMATAERVRAVEPADAAAQAPLPFERRHYHPRDPVFQTGEADG